MEEGRSNHVSKALKCTVERELGEMGRLAPNRCASLPMVSITIPEDENGPKFSTIESYAQLNQTDCEESIEAIADVEWVLIYLQRTRLSMTRKQLSSTRQQRFATGCVRVHKLIAYRIKQEKWSMSFLALSAIRTMSASMKE